MQSNVVYIRLSFCSNPFQQPPPETSINHSTQPISRYYPPHPRQCCSAPIPPYPQPPIPPTHLLGLSQPPNRSIIQIQPQQMQRRAEQLHSGRCHELRYILASNHRPKQRWNVEGCENTNRVAESEESQDGSRNSTLICSCQGFPALATATPLSDASLPNMRANWASL